MLLRRPIIRKNNLHTRSFQVPAQRCAEGCHALKCLTRCTTSNFRFSETTALHMPQRACCLSTRATGTYKLRNYPSCLNSSKNTLIRWRFSNNKKKHALNTISYFSPHFFDHLFLQSSVKLS